MYALSITLNLNPQPNPLPLSVTLCRFLCTLICHTLTLSVALSFCVLDNLIKWSESHLRLTNMSDFNAICHGCHGDSITRKRIRSGIAVCHNELTKCQQELTVSKAENVRVYKHFNGTKKKPIPNCCEVWPLLGSTFLERKIGISEWRQLSRKSKQDRMYTHSKCQRRCSFLWHGDGEGRLTGTECGL